MADLHINLDIIAKNYKFLSSISDAELAAVVKSDAYGLGALKIAPTLSKVGCKKFFVASGDEGILLRTCLGKNAQIYVFYGVSSKDELDSFLEYDLVPVLNNEEQVIIWQEYGKKINKILPAILNIDTGMNRTGFGIKEFKKLYSLEGLKNFDLRYVMTHLVSCEHPQDSKNKDQLLAFVEFHKKMMPEIKSSISNSGAIFLGEEYHLDMIRAGALLYGLKIRPDLMMPQIKNPIKLFAKVLQIKELRPNESVGYNSAYTNKEGCSITVAALGIGYAHGLFRNLSNKGCFVIGNTKVPIIGNISMDITVIDISKVKDKEIIIGDKIEIMNDSCNPDDIAKISGTIGYEVLTSLGKGCSRVYND